MGYEMGVRQDVLVVTGDGKWTRCEAEASLREAGRAAWAISSPAVLLDLRRVELQATVTDVYELARVMGQAFAPGTWHAVVMPRSDPAGLGRFYETAARNRGLMVRRFSNTTEAAGWLREAVLRSRKRPTREPEQAANHRTEFALLLT
ncbi:MAG: hypothetical protein ACOC1F_09170 [Myxococcota bacterium]